MTAVMPPHSVFEGEPTLADLLRLLHQGRRTLVKAGLAGFAAGLLFLFLAVPHYRATMLVGPTGRMATADMTLPPGAQGDFAADYMLKSFSAGRDADFAWFIHILRGPGVAASLLQDGQVKNGVADDTSFHFLSWRRMPRNPEALSAYLVRHIDIAPVGDTPLRRLTFDHPDKGFARVMLQKAVADADNRIRTAMRAKADRRIARLEQAIRQEQAPDTRRALTDLLIQQRQIRMMLGLDETYAVHVIESASVTARPVWPRTGLILPLFTLIGLMIGFATLGTKRALARP